MAKPKGEGSIIRLEGTSKADCRLWRLRFNMDDGTRRDSVICHIGYTAECEPYTADVYLWLDGECEEFKLRMSEGVLSIQ